MVDRAQRGGGRSTPVDPFQVNFLSTGRTGVGIETGTGADWFGPLNPMAPTAPPEVAGRIFDFPAGYNLVQTPRAYEAIGFPELRALGDGYDLLRTLIEARKDQMAALDWNIQPRDAESKKKKPKDKDKVGKRIDGTEDARVLKIEQFFMRPDRVHGWDTWLRMVLEDLLVIDAPTLWVRRTRGGELYALEPIDGATIKRVIDDWGRTPEPPIPAYQQVLKGLPAVDYAADELIYAPRNVRTSKVYGYSPVEQIVITINIALRRQVYQLQYYTEGNVPEALIGVPETWTPTQIADFQAWWDSVLEGNTAQRRHAKFVPGGVAKTFIATKEPDQKNMYDEWLARVCCFALSISPEAFVAIMNRATAETSQNRAMAEGLAPLKGWVKQLVDGVLEREFKAPDLEFRWQDQPEPDPDKQQTRLTAYVEKGIMAINEAREQLGLDPVEGGEEPAIYGSNPTPVADIGLPPEPLLGLDGEPIAPAPFGGKPGFGKPGAGAKDEDGKEKKPKADDAAEDAEVGKAAGPPFGLSKAQRDLRTARRSRVQNRQRRILRRKLARSFRALADNTAEQITRLIDQRRRLGIPIGKQAGSDDEQRRALEEAQRAINEAMRAAEAEAIAAGLDFGEWQVLIMPTEEALEAVARDSSMRVVTQLQLGAPDDYLVTQVHEKARDYARQRAAEMVGMRKMPNGDLIQNPHARWAITDSTRDEIRGIIVEAIDPGLDPDELRDKLRESASFSEDRADLVARTELARAHNEGNMIGMKESREVVGDFKKKWLTAGDDRVSPECEANGKQGAIPLDAAFQSGDDMPPAHPRCRCVLVPVLDETQPNQGE